MPACRLSPHSTSAFSNHNADCSLLFSKLRKADVFSKCSGHENIQHMNTVGEKKQVFL